MHPSSARAEAMGTVGPGEAELHHQPHSKLGCTPAQTSALPCCLQTGFGPKAHSEDPGAD